VSEDDKKHETPPTGLLVDKELQNFRQAVADGVLDGLEVSQGGPDGADPVVAVGVTGDDKGGRMFFKHLPGRRYAAVWEYVIGSTRVLFVFIKGVGCRV
jgi:hypothetical protein